ncbi:MAG TPA: carboxypeptidase-like regulatory domain-containing protein [Bacteroidales bacterium]|nr:carboxypeptidase-like regulatory domain-containing protein [Bacteroidales bacterium]
MSRYFFSLALLISFLTSALAQEQEPYMQLSGMVKNDLNDPIPYVHVIVKKSERSTVSDPNGLYTVIVEPRDTVYFSCVGFKLLKIVMPPSLSTRHINREVHMEVDTVMLKNVIIFPWRTYAEFKDAVIHSELPMNKDLEAAEMNIALIQAQILLSYSNSPNMNFRSVMMQQFERSRVWGQSPYYGIFDVMAWTKFIKALKNGEFKRKK